jgi:hypothetical protein
LTHRNDDSTLATVVLLLVPVLGNRAGPISFSRAYVSAFTLVFLVVNDRLACLKLACLAQQRTEQFFLSEWEEMTQSMHNYSICLTGMNVFSRKIPDHDGKDTGAPADLNDLRTGMAV